MCPVGWAKTIFGEGSNHFRFEGLLPCSPSNQKWSLVSAREMSTCLPISSVFSLNEYVCRGEHCFNDQYTSLSLSLSLPLPGFIRSRPDQSPGFVSSSLRLTKGHRVSQRSSFSSRSVGVLTANSSSRVAR